MDAASRYAREYLLGRPAVVVLRAPTGYLKTSTTRIAAQQARSSAIVDCRELGSAAELEAALSRRVGAALPAAEVEDFIAFENADAALGDPEVLAAIHAVLLRRGARQTIAICTKRPFPLPPDVLASAVELTLDELAIDAAVELADRGLSAERLAEIQRLALGWPMATYRLASIALACPPGVPLAACANRAYDRLLQDVRLDFIDRLPRERRARLISAHDDDRDAVLAYAEPESRRDLLASKLARAEGLLLRDGVRHRVPGIVVAALDAMGASTAGARDPAIVFDVLAGAITADGEPIRLPPREFEVFVNLAVKGRPVPYDVLLEEVWGDADDDHGKLKVTIGRLRKRLGSGTIRSIDAGYAIGPNVSCTLAELEELAAMSPPLGDAMIARLDAIRLRHHHGMAGTTRHWPWYAVWSGKIDAFVEKGAVTVGRHALSDRRYAVALERAQDAIALNPLSQEAHELALRALVAQGNVVGARQMLAGYEVKLRQTLGIALPETLERIVCAMAS